MGPLRRIGLLGDIHAEDTSLAVALRVLADAGVDALMAVGDIADGPGSVDRCCDLLATAGALAVRGNHERWLLAGTMRDLPDATHTLGAEARAFLGGLPATRRFDVPGGQVLLCHGLGDDDMASVDPEDRITMRYDPPLLTLLDEERTLWVLNGHTHRRGVWSERTLTIVNAGTLFREHDPCFVLVDLALREVTYFDLDRSGGRVARQQTVPLPPPRGARR
jgi:predicted phosphodiesterase